MSDVNAIPQWFSGSEHTHRVAAAIAQYGPIARTTLAQMLGLSQGALSRITSDLIYAGVIEELPAEAGPSGKLPERFTPRESSDRRGRPQTSLVLCSNARTFIGVKVHGMSIVAAAVNAHGEVVSGGTRCRSGRINRLSMWCRPSRGWCANVPPISPLPDYPPPLRWALR